MSPRGFLPLVAALALSACATLPEDGASGRGLTCSTQSYGATMGDEAAARHVAETSIRHQVADVRGEMITAGLRRVRLAAAPTQCQRLPGPTGEVYCKASIQVCGR